LTELWRNSKETKRNIDNGVFGGQAVVMKSAYELAMEKLEKEEPSTGGISEERKMRLDEVSKTYLAKIAEREVFLRGKIASARGNPGEIEALQRELRDEKRRLEAECEEKKEVVRKG